VDDLDLRRLRYFVAVAESLSFIRAAGALHMTQPALSRQIAALEKSLGVRLFERSRRGTELTAAGAEILDEARAVLAGAAELQRAARTADRSQSRFTIGFMPGVDAGVLIRAFQHKNPGLEVTAVFTSMTDQVEFLSDGRVDIAFVRPPLGTSALEVVPLFDEAVVAVVPSADALAQRDAVQLDELDEPLRLVGPLTVEELLLAVATSDGHALLPAGIAAFYTDPSVAYVPIVDGPVGQVALAYDARRVMPALGEFVRVCRHELGPAIASLPAVLQERRGRTGEPLRVGDQA